jgi:hypothetical protein
MCGPAWPFARVVVVVAMLEECVPPLAAEPFGVPPLWGCRFWDLARVVVVVVSG